MKYPCTWGREQRKWDGHIVINLVEANGANKSRTAKMKDERRDDSNFLQIR